MDAEYIFEKLTEVVEYVYKGIEISDYQAILKRTQIEDVSAVDDFKEKIEQDLRNRISREKSSTLEKIQEVLNNCPELSSFFIDNKTFDNLSGKLNKKVLAEEIYKNSEVLLAKLENDPVSKMEDDEDENGENDDNENGEDDDENENGENGDGNDNMIWELFTYIVSTFIQTTNTERLK